MILDTEEQLIEDSFETLGGYPNPEKTVRMKLYYSAAKQHLKKDKRVTLRVSSHDLEQLQRLAAEEGLPYQSYITSVLHKVSTGRLKDVRA
jgi:predicted DNA binding CopG/RHH family protein